MVPWILEWPLMRRRAHCLQLTSFRGRSVFIPFRGRLPRYSRVDDTSVGAGSDIVPEDSSLAVELCQLACEGKRRKRKTSRGRARWPEVGATRRKPYMDYPGAAPS